MFVDDGISGAEFANRPGFLRLMNALEPRPTFQVLHTRAVNRKELVHAALTLGQACIARAGRTAAIR